MVQQYMHTLYNLQNASKTLTDLYFTPGSRQDMQISTNEIIHILRAKHIYFRLTSMAQDK
jgi:hypothetical protein